VLDQFGGFLSASASTTRDGEASNVLEGVVNVPVLANRLAVRAVAYREEMGGYIDDSGVGQSNAGGSLRQGARLGAALRLSNAWQVHALYVEQAINSDNTHYAETGWGDYGRSLNVAEPHRNHFDGLSGVIEGDLGWARLKIASAVQRHDIQSRYDASLSLPMFTAGPIESAAYDEASHTNASVTEATLISRPTGAVTWLAGVFLSDSAQARTGSLTSLSGGPEIYDEDRRDSLDEYAVYGEATWKATDRLRLTLGGRYYQLSTTTDSTVQQPDEALSSTFSGETSNHGFSPKALIEFDWSDAVLLYAEAAQGYRAGGFNTGGLVGQAFSAPGAGPQPYRTFAYDSLSSYEAGARLSLLDGDLKIRLAAFQARWNNIQADRLLPAGLPFTANVGDGGSSGLEFESTWTMGRYRLNTDLMLSNPELSDPDPSFPTPEDRHLPGVAGVTFNTELRSDWKTRGLDAYWSIQAGYVGKSTLTFDAQVAPRMGGYWTSRLSAGVGDGDWKLSAYIDNLLGESGDTFAYGNPFRLRYRDQNTPQRLTTAGVTLTRGF